MKITLAQCRILDAVARRGGFSSAAAELGVSQPSVSIQLNAFEKRHQTKLFQRDGHTVTLTPLGRAVLPKIKRILALVDDVETALQGERMLATGSLRVGYSAHQFVMNVLSVFMQRHRDVKVEARAMASADLVSMVADGQLDAAFITADSTPAGFESVVLRREEIVLAVPTDHPFAGGGPVPWSAVADTPLVRREPASGTRLVFDAAAAAAGVAPPTALEIGSWEAMRAAVVAGIGVGVGMRGEFDRHEPMAPASLGAPTPFVDHRLVCVEGMTDVAAVAALFEAAAEISGAAIDGFAA